MAALSFKLGVVQFMAFPNTDQDAEALLTSLTTLARDADFALVEITRTPDPATRQRVRDLLEAAHLDCAFAATPVILRNGLNPSATDEATRRQAVVALKECVDEAVALGAKTLTLMSGPYNGDEKAELNAFLRTLDELCAYAADRSPDAPLTVLVEPFDREVDKKALVGPSVLAGALAHEMLARHANFGLLIDLSHLPLLGESVDECLVALPLEAIRHVHIGNCVLVPGDPLYGDQHPPFGYPNSANDVKDVKVFLSALQYSGYFARPSPFGLPTVSFEVKPLPHQDPQTVLANAKRVLQAALLSL